MYWLESTSSILAYRLTDDGVVPARPTCHASLAAHMAREPGVYNHILEIGVAIRIQTRENEKLFLAINSSYYGSQLRCERVRQRESRLVYRAER